ncbi:hypothetical protein JCM33374_g4811 [Metschnikowia sp. JCM 33374]|nr:hypothetical protein JCM33374_g4811 [Metschnikowia sp. JCM 33374]
MLLWCLSRKDIGLSEAVAPYEVSNPEGISVVEFLTNAVAFTSHEISYDETAVEQLKRECFGDREFHGPCTALTSDKPIAPEVKLCEVCYYRWFIILFDYDQRGVPALYSTGVYSKSCA